MADMVLGAGRLSPRLALILEAEEARLTKTDAILEAERTIDNLNRDVLRRFLHPTLAKEQLAVASDDVVTIVRALLDTPGAATDLRPRIRTIEGYLAPLLSTAR